MEVTLHDTVNHPNHYCTGGIETIQFIKAKLTPEEYLGYLKGNAIKYISRAGKKETATEWEDYAKAIWYLDQAKKETKPSTWEDE